MSTTRKVTLYSFCGIPEIGEASSKALSDRIEKAFFSSLAEQEKQLSHRKIIGRAITREKVLDCLHQAAEILSTPDQKVFVYYNGHGDQARDTSGDEADGKDELWKLMGGGRILDDEITLIFKDKIHKTSILILISDNCSSGTMLDRKLFSSASGGSWICLSSCRDHQDSLATSEGGVFTLYGLIPALEAGKRTIRDIYAHIQKEIQIPSQHPFLEVSSEKVLEVDLFC